MSWEYMRKKELRRARLKGYIVLSRGPWLADCRCDRVEPLPTEWWQLALVRHPKRKCLKITLNEGIHFNCTAWRKHGPSKGIVLSKLSYSLKRKYLTEYPYLPWAWHPEDEKERTCTEVLSTVPSGEYNLTKILTRTPPHPPRKNPKRLDPQISRPCMLCKH